MQTTQQETGLPKTRNVFRIDTDAQAAWQVRIQRDGQLYTRSFSDQVHGGTESAYEAAVQWRDETLDELGEADPTAKHLHTEEVRRKAWQSLTRTGVKGIGFTRKRYSRRHDERAPYVTVHWTKPGGSPGYASYSVRRHGAEPALKKATNRLWAERRASGEEGPGPDVLFERAWPNVQQLAANDVD